MKIEINKFKKIDSSFVELSALNIFIGTNNSGKSSFIQGIQFAISACQTLKMKGGKWVRNRSVTLSLDSTEYLYTPTSDISYLFHGKRLAGARTRENRIWIEFKFSENNQEATLKVSRGKNGGFTTMLTGKILGTSLNDIESPYCVYVPGIAGVPVLEKYEVPIAVKKSATRGDSNNYLRNILYTISKSQEKWHSFQESVNSIYPNIIIHVEFNEHESEYLHVFITIDDVTLPLDSVGTGLLQVIQIFAYIEYFSPKIILLDEPDSHIHPTKQKLLSEELVKRTDNDPNLKIVFSTHSRYILESLEGKSKVFHFQNGRAFPDIKNSNILLDIGAADADYLFAKQNLKYVIVTEDKVDNISSKKEFLKKLLLANGLREDEFVLHSYEGCTKVEFAKILEGFVKKQIPTVKVILHIDRDQKIDEDRELIKLRADCESREIIFFLTKYQEVESYFCTPQHIHYSYDIPLLESEALYERFVGELAPETKRKLTNFILRDRPELGVNKDGRPDIDIINNLANTWYELHRFEFTLGKELLGKIKNHAQTELRLDPNSILQPSPGLYCDELSALLNRGNVDQPQAQEVLVNFM